ncbi:fatty acyl-AMP ligase [Pseudochrobactrum kiredjianiae]|uniref:Fatty acyl-AMP ligase n=1 Tax=Pseudochrobactrum kiredjianiae TaxID=386305 RepID=A0ABW3V4D2_9HYPH|nr:fatty acyl-AMP ligase [Pseudochrobactrum kiredjianiae]MDM7852260.1 fatty acyl-AMP ligase [Pseudochrobactrum kiredjianiae]
MCSSSQIAIETMTPAQQPAQRIGDFDTICEALDYAAQGTNGIRIYNAKGEVQEELSYKSLRELALYTGKKLLTLGLGRGDVVAIIADTCVEFFALFYGCQYAGLIPCPLPYTIYLGGKAAYTQRVNNLLKAADAKILWHPDGLKNLSEQFTEAMQIQAFSFSDLADLPATKETTPLQPHEAAYIQFSSGSTSEPKGIIISQRAISHNARGILRECICITPSDRAFSWLPLYHDMGLVGFSIAPLFAQTPVDYISPTLFARRPLLWLQLMSERRSTITYAPIFGYNLAALRHKPEDTKLDLSALKIAGIGGDMINAGQLQQFCTIFADSGFNSDSLTPSYGMAESTLLVSYRHGLKTDTIDKCKLEKDGVAVPCNHNNSHSLTFTFCGKSLKGHELFVGDAQSKPLPARHVGHIYLCGPSLMSGYCNQNATPHPPHDNSIYQDTGDMGYLCDGEIVITGRYKDMITVNGRNIWPQDIEHTLATLPGLSSNRAAAFSVNDDKSEAIIILIENNISSPAERKKLISAVQTTMTASHGTIIKAVLVPPRSLEYTSSGKLSRSKARELYINHYSNRYE